MKYSCDYISGNSNTVAFGSLWFSLYNDNNSDKNDDIIAYAMNNVISISSLNRKSVICTIKGHNGRINAIDKIINDDNVEIVSASEDKTICIHQCYKNNLIQWTLKTRLNGFQASVITLSCLNTSNVGVVIAASDAIGHINIWHRSYSHDNFELIDEMNTSPIQMPHALKLAYLPKPENNHIIALLLGCVDAKIHLNISTALEKVGETSTTTLSKFVSIGSLYGHEEWITCIASKNVDENTVLIATGSQDSKIRVWRISREFKKTDLSNSNIVDVAVSKVNDDDIEDDANEGDNIDAEEGAVQLVQDEITTEARIVFESQTSVYSVFFDALLLGHEDWVTSVGWLTNYPQTIDKRNTFSLFSSSMDRNMIIWKENGINGVWEPRTRIGDVGGMLGGSVGANLLGFTGGCIPDNGKGVLGIGYGGSLHLWLRKNDEQWFPQPFITGHFGPVNDISWSSTGSYLISVSSDQTCRLFAEMKDSIKGWKEISRPQIHGYDLNSVVLSLAPSYQIFSGGDEKVIRVFDAPLIVLDGLEKLCGIKPYSEAIDNIQRVQRAYIPELGLSNKSADLMSKQEKLEQETRNVAGLDWSQPPLEGQLADHTIWPETKKMFAHNYDIVAITLSNNGKILASSCKARNSQSAGINTWDTESMLSIQNLMIHESTVVCLKFSHNDRYLASSGKDRALCIFKLNESTTNIYELCIAQGNAHKRIVWDLCWSGDSSFLITASRDGFCKIWTLGIDESTNNDVIRCMASFSPLHNIAITAIDILPKQIDEDKWLAVIGSETGDLLLYYIGLNNIDYIMKVENHYSHGSTVKRLKFRPIDSKEDVYWFASCSDDFSVRIFNVSL